MDADREFPLLTLGASSTYAPALGSWRSLGVYLQPREIFKPLIDLAERYHISGASVSMHGLITDCLHRLD